MSRIPLLWLLCVTLVAISKGASAPAPLLSEEIRDPLKVVNRLYRQAVESGQDHGDWGVPAHFKKVLKKSWNKVPLLNAVHRVEDLQPGSLVRFRCMVQNVFNPEFFIGVLTGKDPLTNEEFPVSCKYRDSIPPIVDEVPDVQDNDVARSLLERLSALCIPIPGESAWVNQDSISCQEGVSQAAELLATPSKQRGAKRTQPQGDEQDSPALEQESESTLHRRTVRSPLRKGRGRSAGATDSNATEQVEARVARRAKDKLDKAEVTAPSELKMDVEHDAETVQEEEPVVDEARAVEVGGGAKILFESEEVANSVRAAQAHLRKVQAETAPPTSPKREKVPQPTEKRAQSKRDAKWALGQEELWTVDSDLRVMVKFYDMPRSDLELMSVVEVAGVLGLDPVTTSFPRGSDADDSLLEDGFATPNMIPSSVMPRLHALCHRKLSARSQLAYHPFISEGFATPSPRGMRALISAKDRIPELRQRVMELLTDAVGGDELAAEYILCAIISKVVNRPDVGMVIGKCTLCVSEWDPKTSGGTEGLCRALSEILPMFRNITVCPSVLNQGKILPKKDYKLELISISPLQMPESCVLLLQEESYREEDMTSEGHRDWAALRNILLFQTLGVDYQYFSSELEVDNPVIVVAQTHKSRLEQCTDISIPHAPSHAPSPPNGVAEAILKDEELLNLCRGYLAWLRMLKWELHDSISDFVSTDWVQSRQREAKLPVDERQLHSDLFSTWMTLARLLSISHGEETLTEVGWRRMRELENKRLVRIKPDRPSA